MILDQYGDPVPVRYVRRPIGLHPAEPVEVHDDENEPLSVPIIHREVKPLWLTATSRELEYRK